jgi:hypothetical protein
LKVAPPSLGHVALHNVAVAILEHDSLPHPPGTEAGLPVPAYTHSAVTSELFWRNSKYGKEKSTKSVTR